MRVYFARGIHQYNTPDDNRTVSRLQALGYKVIDITSEKAQFGYKNWGMDYFYRLIEEDCDILFFQAFPNRRIGAGVAGEIAKAKDLGIPVFEIPIQIEERTCTVDQTRDMLRLLGVR